MMINRTIVWNLYLNYDIEHELAFFMPLIKKLILWQENQWCRYYWVLH